MPRLLRPYVPIETSCRVVLRQLGEIWPECVIDDARVRSKSLGGLLRESLDKLADVLGCTAAELRRDHDPPLGARRKVFHKGEHVDYDPPANSVDHLRYRPHGAQHAGSHDVKTRVRGDRGQLSDIALVKRNRRLEEQEGTRPKSARTRAKERRADFRSRADKSKPKWKWPKRQFPKRSKP